MIDQSDIMLDKFTVRYLKQIDAAAAFERLAAADV